MSYRRGSPFPYGYIGKQIPGQVNMLSPELAYLPTTGYVEHGSWVTGDPDIVAWEPPEGAGLQMFSTAPRGLHGLGCFIGRLFSGGAPTATPAAVPTSFASAIDTARAAADGASPSASIVGRGTVECAGQNVYSGDALTAMTYAISAARTRNQPCIARMTGTPRGDAVVYVDATGRPSRRPPAGTSGLGQMLTDFACSGSALNASWTTRTRDTLGAAAQAAIAGGVMAGVAGAISKKPALGAALGAAVAFGAFKVWTAPYQV